MKRLIISVILLCCASPAFCWGFYAHRMINFYAVFLLPPEMLHYYKSHIHYLAEHATDPDKRRYAVNGEAPKHYIDIDLYGSYPFEELPRNYDEAKIKFSEDTLLARGTVPWHVVRMYHRLKQAFKDQNKVLILKYSAEIGHYISDAHVPLHTSHNHNGQYSNQHGIHGLWESSIPELLASDFSFYIGKAQYISSPESFIWDRVLESASASDSVLRFEKELSARFHAKYNFEIRNGINVRQYAARYVSAYDKMLNGMVERRMRMAIFSVASFWFTAWVDAGQPNLNSMIDSKISQPQIDSLQKVWKGEVGIGCD